MSLLDKQGKQGPRKLLALDGGGIRGVMTLRVLARMESMLEEALGRGPDFVLSDYFDYVAGTSTGAIIATCLSLGMRVGDILKFYEESGPVMFDKNTLLERYYRNKFKDEKLAATIRNVIVAQASKRGIEPEDGEHRLGTRALQTYLMLMLRNSTTDSPWPISNNLEARFNDPNLPDCNLRLPLWQLVRASTAAPTYFPPEVIRFGDTYEFIFVDGGVTMYNNPAFQLFLMATARPYRLQWPTGEREMLIVSIGTGAAADANASLTPNQMNVLYNATSVPSALMFAAANEQDLLCRIFGRCLHGGVIDAEVGDLIGDRGPFPVTPKLFTYLRYNADLSRAGLDTLGLRDVAPGDVQQLDSIAHIADLKRVGDAVASGVDRAHFDGFLA